MAKSDTGYSNTMPPARRSFSDAVDSASAAPVSSDETPLLRNDAVKPKFQRVIVAISVILLISQVGNFIAMAPQTAILEGIICREHAPLSSESEDGLCKSEPVQTELALVLGWKDTFEMIPGTLSLNLKTQCV